MKKSVILVLIVVCALVVGFYQERIKISVNYVLEYGESIPGFFQMSASQKHEAIEAQRVFAPFDYYHNHSTETWIYNLNQSQLVKLKWSITGFFIVLFCLINASIVWLVSNNKRMVHRVVVFYAGLTLIAFSIYVFGHLSGYTAQAYAMSRKVTGALQSLVPSMIIVPALWLLKIQKRQHEST